MEEVVGAEQSVVRGGELGGKHGTEGKAAAAVGGVGDADFVGLAVPGDGVYAWHFALTYGIDAQLRGWMFGGALNRAVGQTDGAFHPILLAVNAGTYLLGERDGGEFYP